MWEITNEQCEAVSEAVASGVGMVDCYGGMCDSFRKAVLWHFIIEGQWVAHHGGDDMEYAVKS